MPKVLEFDAILGAPDRGHLGGFDLLYQHRPKRSRTNEDELLLEKRPPTGFETGGRSNLEAATFTNQKVTVTDFAQFPLQKSS